MSRIRKGRKFRSVVACWEDYTKKKYKNALLLWNKQTGGGDGHASNFANYTGPGDGNRWVAWIFLTDTHVEYLFATCTVGKVPSKAILDEGSLTSNMSSAFIPVKKKKTRFYA